MEIFLSIIGILVVVFYLWYAGIIKKRNTGYEALSGIDVQLKKRSNLIPNILKIAQKFLQHEKSLLTEITELRTKALTGGISDNEKVDLDNKITSHLGGIMVAVENYPDLKASDNFIQLQRSLNEVEEQISASRRSYNAAVTDYNNGVEMFPTNLIAGMMSFKRKNVFEIPDVQRENVDVENLFNN